MERELGWQTSTAVQVIAKVKLLCLLWIYLFKNRSLKRFDRNCGLRRNNHIPENFTTALKNLFLIY